MSSEDINISQAIALVKEWIDQLQRETVPGIVGAYLIGSMPYRLSDPDHELKPYDDIDIRILVKDNARKLPRFIQQHYKGVNIEATFDTISPQYDSAEQVLSNPTLASHFTVNSMLKDLTGRLAGIQPQVARQFAFRKWVKQRCDYHKERIDNLIQNEEIFIAKESFFLNKWHLCLYLSDLIATAHGQPLTYRKCLINAGKFLKKQQLSSLYRELLHVTGLGNLDRNRAALYFRDCTEAFDLAVRIKQTDTFYGHKIYAHLRPYHMSGTQRIIDEGYPREAMFWISLLYYAAYEVIQNDASEAEKAEFGQKFGQFAMVITPEKVKKDPQGYMHRLKKLVQKIYEFTDEAVQQYPEHPGVSSGLN